MWTANLSNGDSVNSKMMYWTDLSKERKLTAVQLTHPHFQKLYICLKDYDNYYYVVEAMAYPGQATPNVLAEIIGAQDLESGIGIEMKLTYQGNVQGSTYPLAKFKYTPAILIPGKRVEKVPSYSCIERGTNGEEVVISKGTAVAG
jgi:hypothetical protein